MTRQIIMINMLYMILSNEIPNIIINYKLRFMSL